MSSCGSDDGYGSLPFSEDGSLHSSDWTIGDTDSDDTWTLSSDSLSDDTDSLEYEKNDSPGLV